MVYLLKMVIFHSYVSLPEGIQNGISGTIYIVILTMKIEIQWNYWDYHDLTATSL